MVHAAVCQLEKDRIAMQRGTAGEDTVARILANLPREFHVINDLTTPRGNLDHVVVGPTGVFLIDAKNWRGVVSSNGSGELLLNGRPTTKPEVRNFVSRVMNIRQHIKALAPQTDTFFHSLFAFTAARVEAKWGTSGKVHCVCDDQLFDYIVEKNFGKCLTSEEATSVAQAFLGLAHMDRDFTERTTAPSSSSQQSKPAFAAL
jgi:hypothetical protein